MANRGKGGDYDVGYGKPPPNTQWKPGQSGNPKGREKGSRGLKTDLVAVLDERQTIMIKDQEVTGRRQFLALQTLAHRAAMGDLKAQALLFPMLVQVLGVEDRGAKRRSLSAADQALLEAMLGEQASLPVPPEGDSLGDTASEDGEDV